MLIAVQLLFSSTLPLRSLLFFVCHCNDELSMRRSSAGKFSHLTPSRTFEPCRLLTHSNQSFWLSGCITHKELASVLQGSSQNNFTSLLKAAENKQIRNAHSQPPRKVAGVTVETKQRRLFQSRFTSQDQLFGLDLFSHSQVL